MQMHGAQSLLPNTVFSDVCSPLWCSHEANSQGRPAETLLMRDNLVLLGAAERANVSASCQNKNMAGFLLLLFFFPHCYHCQHNHASVWLELFGVTKFAEETEVYHMQLLTT